ncbi:hypothetical protein HMSSN036_82770 [Paenibacillus macerans]|nr:hypothetical protein HMSSN036_82770 [Paenibacillus macerans]
MALAGGVAPDELDIQANVRANYPQGPDETGFWYCGFTAPHPPVVPPQVFMDMYNDVDVERPYIGDWAKDSESAPYPVKYYSSLYDIKTDNLLRKARKGSMPPVHISIIRSGRS